MRALRMQVWRKQGREEEPGAAITESQSVKTSAVRGPKKGFHIGKKSGAGNVTQGNLLAIKGTGAELSNREGDRSLLGPLKELLPRLKLIWGDSPYGAPSARGPE